MNPQWFADAIDAIESEGKNLPGYHKDLAPYDYLSPKAQILLHACQKSWFFGGMGSWNDMGFNGADPRTDGKILSNVIEYIYLNQGNCTIAESANGYLRENLEQLGLEEIINKYNIGVLDLDFEDVEEVIIDDEKHYIPKRFRNFGVRVAIPATSKRPEMIFSNNVKLFVGAVPRRMYQMDGNYIAPRPLMHIDLHKSVANLFCAIQHYASFDFFINGGLAMDENRGEFTYKENLVGNDGIELDLYVLYNLFSYLEKPEYLKRLESIEVERGY